MICAFDWESFIVQGHISATPLVCLGTNDPAAPVLDRAEGIRWMQAKLADATNRFVNWRISFDWITAIGDPSWTTADVQNLLQAYSDLRVVDVQVADKLLAIQQGTFKMRKFSLADSSKAFLGKDFSEDKGSGAIWSGKGDAATAQRVQLFKLLRQLGDTLRAAEDADICTLLQQISNICPLEQIPWRYKYALLAETPVYMYPEKARQYVAEDPQYALELLEKLIQVAEGASTAAGKGYVDSQGLPWRSAEASMADFGLQLLAEVPLWVRPEYVASLRKESEDFLAATTTALIYDTDLVKWRKTGPHAGTWGTDTVALRAAVDLAYAREGLVAPQTPKGQAQITDKVLAECPGRDLELIRLWREADKMVTTIVPLLERAPLKTAFWSPIVTLRAASGGDNFGNGEINSMNFKKEGGFMQAFRPPSEEEALEVRTRLKLPDYTLRPGDRYVFIDADYSQLELFPLSMRNIWNITGKAVYQPGISQLADDLVAGVDFHSKLAAADLGMPYEIFIAARKDDPYLAKLRQNSKQVVYGAGGLMGPEKMALTAFRTNGIKMRAHPNGMWDVQGSIEEAKRLLALLLRMYPELAAHRQRFYSAGENQQAFCIPSMQERGQCSATEAGNFVFQPPAAIIATRALFWMWQACYSGGLPGCCPHGFVHDSIRMVAPEQYAACCAAVLKESMLRSLDLECPGMRREFLVKPFASEVIEKEVPITLRDGKLVASPASLNAAKPFTLPWVRDGYSSAREWLKDVPGPRTTLKALETDNEQ